MTTEKFGAWHKDCKITNASRTAENWRLWCYHRTCYGSVKIPSNTNAVVTWKIKMDLLHSDTYIGYICVGIDSIQQTDTWFYQNKQSANYGYECTGNMYELGQVKNRKHKYGRGDLLEMELNTGLELLTFYKYGNTEKLLQHSFKIETGPQLIYKLAISIKHAKVVIFDFNMLPQNDLNNEDIKQQSSEFEGILSLKKENKKLNDVNLSLKKQIDAFERENKEENININEEINKEMIKYKQIFNEAAITKICKDNPRDILDANSWLHRDIERCENNIGNMMKSLHSFKEYIESRKVMMNSLASPKQNEYKEWNIDMMVMWLASIENGRFVKYLNVLRNAFVISDITNGEYLPDLDIATLSVEPFNITSFPDKRDLVRNFKQLKAKQAIEGVQVDDGIRTKYH